MIFGVSRVTRPVNAVLSAFCSHATAFVLPDWDDKIPQLVLLSRRAGQNPKKINQPEIRAIKM